MSLYYVIIMFCVPCGVFEQLEAMPLREGPGLLGSCAGCGSGSSTS